MPAIVVFSAAEKDEIGIRTLVGEYSEEGTNHGRKFYKKTSKIPGHEDISVYLYFWDERDGPSFSGWWFGNQVGGAQVWSRNKLTSLQPPKQGWTIPWDGDVKKDLMVISGTEKQALDLGKAPATPAAPQAQAQAPPGQQAAEQAAAAAEWEARVQRATEKAADMEIDTSTALEHAREVMLGELDDALVLEAQRELAAQASSLAEVQREIATEGLAAQRAPSALKAEMVALGQRMRKLQAQVKEQLQTLKNSKDIKAKQAEEEERRAEVEGRERELEGAHAKQLEEMMPAAMEKVDLAEDEVEKVAIAAAPLQIDTADELRSVMLQAIKETEQRVRGAQAAIGEARRFISGKLSQVGRFVSSTKKQATEEFTALQVKLNEAQEKLSPYKNVRQDYEQRVQAKKLYEELSGRLASAEIEVEKAAMMTAPLGGDNTDGLKETETALGAAQSALSQSVRLIESKMRLAEKNPGPLRDEITALQERGKLAQEKLDEVRKAVREAQTRIAADALLREVSERVSTAEDELQKMAEAELPFLRGTKIQDIDTLIAEADKVAVRVHSALAEAQTFVAKKLVEVARFTGGPAQTVKEEIDMLQKRLEEGRERLQQFRSSTADRKRSHVLEEVEAKVAAAEGEVQRMTEAAEPLGSIGAAGDSVAEGLTEAVEQANLAEQAAQASILVARKYLLQKTTELKKLAISGSGSGSELGKLQSRVNNMQQEVSKLQNATKDAEERIRAKQMLSEVLTRLQAAESEVDRVSAAALPLAEEQPSAEVLERMGRATASAQGKLGATAKLVDAKLKSAQGFLKEELTGMRARIAQSEKKLDEVISSATEQKERLKAAELIAQATENVEGSEAKVQKAAEAELPFLKGIEVLAAADAQKAIAVCEAAAASAQTAITNARAFLSQKLAEAEEFSEGPSETCTTELLALQKRLDESGKKLAELSKDTADRKRKAQMQVSGEKISDVETAVQKLADVMSRFTDEKLAAILPADARGACEEIAQAEQDARAGVADARKFLALRMQDIKSLAESVRGPATADLAKLQSRLTLCEVELAKLSKQCSEQEQHLLAKKLVQDAEASLGRLQADVEKASGAAAPLLAEDGSELLAVACMQSLVCALQAYARKSELTAEGVWALITRNKNAKLEEFAAFLDRLAELTGQEDAVFSEAQKAAVFAQAGGKGGKLNVVDFQMLMRERFVCVESAPATDQLEGGKELGAVASGEGIEVLEQKEDGEGSKRAMCCLSRDGTRAWVTLVDKAGASRFMPSPPFAGRMESIEAYIDAVQATCAEASAAADKKTVEVAGVKQGPLSDVKSKLLQVRTKFGAEQSKMDTLKKRASAAKAAVLAQRREDLQKLHEAKCKAFAEQSVKQGTDVVRKAEEQAKKVMQRADLGGAKKPGIAQLESVKAAADDALQALAGAKAEVTRALEAHEAFTGSARNLLLEARVELTKLVARATAAERQLRTATEAVRTAYLSVVKTATRQAREALRSAARKLGQDVDQLFEKVSGGKGEITAAQFSEFVKSLPGLSLKQEEVSLVYKEFGRHGLRKLGLAKVLQEFARCERDTAITKDLSASSLVIRKLEQGELFEVLEGPKDDTEAQEKRVRGRALRDGTSGWVTLKGSQGTFLKPREKPFLWVTREAAMLKDFDDKSPTIKELQRDEVLELLEGPREEASSSEVYLKASTCKETATGWAILRDLAGATYASQSQDVYVCRSTIAMTDAFDIQQCKVLRKVDVGEALLVVGGQEVRTDTEKSITRLKFRGVRDSREGWITLRGNQGTVFVEVSNSHYVVERDMALREGMAKDSPVVRQLKVGDVIHGLSRPEEIRPDARMGVRARPLEDGAAGWISFSASHPPPVLPWLPKYTCKAAVALTPALAAKNADTVRQAEPGEVFEAVEGPTRDPSTGLRRIRCATAADGVVGWATLRGADGTAFLEP